MAVLPSTQNQVRRATPEMSLEDILRILDEDGGVIIERFMPLHHIRALESDVQPHLDNLGPLAGQGDENFHGKETRKLSGLPLISTTFREDILNHKLMHEICRKVFNPSAGDYWLTSAQVLEKGPGGTAQILHRDQELFTILVELGEKAPFAMINFIVALTEFTEDNGATRVIPKSHKWPDFKDAGTPEQTVPATMKPGDVFVFNGKLAHGGGQNVTKDYTRRALNISFQASYLTPLESHVDIPLAILRTMTPLAQKMVAWRSTYPANKVGLWTLRYNDLGDELKL